MKTLNLKNFLYLIVALLAPVFVSCSDDDKDEPTPIPVYDSCNVLYKGTMTTSFSAMGTIMDYSTEETEWNVIINEYDNTAIVKIINAKFAAMMPSQPLLVLENLKYNPTTNEVTGSNIIPKSKEGDGLTPNENFPFESFTATFNNKLRNITTIDFVVNGAMLNGIGKFEGKAYLPQ